MEYGSRMWLGMLISLLMFRCVFADHLMAKNNKGKWLYIGTNDFQVNEKVILTEDRHKALDISNEYNNESNIYGALRTSSGDLSYVPKKTAFMLAERDDSNKSRHAKLVLIDTTTFVIQFPEGCIVLDVRKSTLKLGACTRNGSLHFQWESVIKDNAINKTIDNIIGGPYSPFRSPQDIQRHVFGEFNSPFII